MAAVCVALVVLVVAVLVGGAVLRSDQRGDVAVPAAREAAPQERLVGRDGLVLAVPSDWRVVEGGCGGPEADRVKVFGNVVPACIRGPMEQGQVGIEISDAAPPTAGARSTVGGRVVRTTKQPATDVPGSIRVDVTSLDGSVSFTVTGPRDLVTPIVASLRPMPRSYVAVPPRSVAGDEDTDLDAKVVRRYERAGLRAELADRVEAQRVRQREARRRLREGGADEVMVDPPPGTIVRIGARVLLTR